MDIKSPQASASWPVCPAPNSTRLCLARARVQGRQCHTLPPHVKSAAQLERLCTSLRRLIVAETGFEPFIAIDQEEGVVSRFSPDMAITPGAMALAAPAGTRLTGRHR